MGGVIDISRLWWSDLAHARKTGHGWTGTETAAAKESRGHFTGHRRASMGEERRSALAVIHTHYDMAIDLEEVIDIFANLHPRKLELKTLLQ